MKHITPKPLTAAIALALYGTMHSTAFAVPQKAINACSNLSENDSCSIPKSDGSTISGFCTLAEDQLFCDRNATGPGTSIGSTSNSLPDTGQTSCFDGDGEIISCPAAGVSFYGQDAQYSGNAPSYTDNGDGTVTDNLTGLMWQQDPDTNSDGSIDSTDRISQSDAVSGVTTLTPDGYNDWRIPTIKELYSLIDFNGATGSGDLNSSTVPDDAVPYIDTDYLMFGYGSEDRFIDAQYWSTTDYVSTTMNNNDTNFGVNFADGRIKGYPASGSRFVRYVRGCTDYGVNSFSDNSNGTISDANSGLMWLQNDSGAFNTGYSNIYADSGSLNWEEALAWCEGLSYAGYGDWRLPNAKELQGIVDYSRSPDTTNSAAIDSLFYATLLSNGINSSGTPNYPYYWTSTSHQDGPNFAVYIAFGEARGYMGPNGTTLLDVHGAGSQRSDPKTGDPTQYTGIGHGPQGDVVGIYNYARCVRDTDADVAIVGQSPVAGTDTGTVASQCAVYNPAASPQVDIPCVAVDGTVYSAGLNIVSATTGVLRFDTDLSSLTQVSLTPGTDCGVYDSTASSLRLNCVDIGNGTRLWVEMDIVPGATGVPFDLGSYGLQLFQ